MTVKNNNDTIAAVSTPNGVGGIAVIRISGPDAISTINSAWEGTDLESVKSHTLHLGKYYSLEGNLLDEGIASVFRAPASFTGENVVELSVHGSAWIQREVLADLIKRGARIANPGEFTQRAFLNGKIDLAQAEGVADLIASSSKAAHDLAISQVKGLFSKEFNLLRDKLIEFASLLELELDFSEEDVEFADREALLNLCSRILGKINSLAASYSKGAVLKNGVPVVIAGIPNAGKSSLLNLLLNDDKAIVTDIPGTTRDIIEDTIELDGILYRFIDTAGLRSTTDKVEGIGVDRARESMKKAFIIIWVIDTTAQIEKQVKELNDFKENHPSKNIIIILNKTDISGHRFYNEEMKDGISFSTLSRQGMSELIDSLHKSVKANSNPEQDLIVTNARHYEALLRASEALTRAKQALSPASYTSPTSSDSNTQSSGIFPGISHLQRQATDNLPHDFTTHVSVDFIAQDIREAISHLSVITGSITTEDLLTSIFSNFCIGK